ncbi:Helix-turn-helix domain-containing protein [Orenia metallireducens]|uniref:Helix-turn-helix domain-containing protein n=1 Tax=Orenia metallireducens TaxID=1413210 RepID=A0A285G6K4_9FIRM|nr:helix-turn-helix transcriptional regulator [Orenia metallireducens]SNY19169.1 Helix-turn-helix domain-containing protein [Orenia metallireducens]
MKYGERLRELRKDKGLTMDELAEQTGLSQSYISEIERNIKEPKFDKLNLLANYFDVSVDYILGRTNIKSKNTDKITQALEDNPELADFWEQLKKRESMQLLFKQTRNMSDKSIRDVVRFMKSVEDELDRNNY